MKHAIVITLITFYSSPVCCHDRLTSVWNGRSVTLALLFLKLKYLPPSNHTLTSLCDTFIRLRTCQFCTCVRDRVCIKEKGGLDILWLKSEIRPPICWKRQLDSRCGCMWWRCPRWADLFHHSTERWYLATQNSPTSTGVFWPWIMCDLACWHKVSKLKVARTIHLCQAPNKIRQCWFFPPEDVSAN